MRKKVGSALVDYAIPTLLVGVVFGAGLYSFISSGNIINFLSGSQKMSVSMKDQMGIIGSNTVKSFGSIKPGGLGGTPSSPKEQCGNGSCIIDYGNFIITGVPENFGEIVETAGSSGGTDKLAELLKQIGAQVNDTDKTDGDVADDFLLIANMEYFMSDLQEQSELAAKACATDADPVACFNQKSIEYNSKPLAAPDNIKSYLGAWPNVTDNLSGILTRNDLGWMSANYDFYNKEPYKSVFPAWRVVDSYKRIMASDSSDGVTTEMKQIASSLIQQVDVLNDNLYNAQRNFLGESGNYANYDPVTGSMIWDNPSSYPSTIDDLHEPKTSNNTDIRAKIFCATGNGSVIGSNCK